jgi:hypothetical protein
MLDAMERRETNSEELEDLFKVDHLATRMRRNAENLIVLSGAVPGRGWRNAVPMVDVVRGAVGEVEDYTRVTVLPIGSSALEGRAVGDVIHLLAELIENAVSFSPPYTVVHISGHPVANGFAIEVEDRGLGMSEADLETANEQLRKPPEFNLTSTARLGLYVVGRLAERHGIKVRLRESPYGGTTAIVLLPQNLVIHGADSPAALRDQRGEQRAAIASGDAAIGDEVVTGDVVAEADRSGSGLVSTGRHSAGPAADPDPVQRTAAVDAIWPATVEPVRAEAEPVRAGDEPIPAEVTASADPLLTARPVPSPDGTVPGQIITETPFGLPRRVRQASLAAPLRQESRTDPGPDATATAQPPVAPGRRPEQVREMMASYQRATNRGRLDAGRPDAIGHLDNSSEATDATAMGATGPAGTTTEPPEQTEPAQ